MRRSALDKLVSFMGLALAVLLFVGGGLLVFGSTFVNQQVADQLTSQKIQMPSGQALERLNNAEDKAALEPYAGQMMSTGAQAQAFADHYILNHMNASSDGRTYEEVSGEFQKLSDAEKASPEGQELSALRMSLFMGNSIRGMLLNAYAFGTMAMIMAWAAVAAFIGGAAMLVLAILGFRHAKTAGDQMVS